MNASLIELEHEDLAPEGAELLNDVRGFVKRFCVFRNDECLTAVTLWAALTHMVEHFHTTPRLVVVSPEYGSGKTRVLEVLHLLTVQAMLCLSPSSATIFRKLAKEMLTLLIDESDTIFTKRGKDDANEDLRGLLNAGYRRGSTIPRCVGPKHDVIDFPVFCPVAMAGIGDLPDTIMSRAVIIRMQRRAPHEKVDSFRLREHEAVGHELRDRIATWAASVGAKAGAAWPKLPEGVVDRAAEIWEPLIAVADAAGGEWPKLARAACVSLCRVSQERRASLGVRLLTDLRTVFADADALHTETIIERLCNGEAYGLDADAPWSELHGKAIGVRTLASMLKRYGIEPTKVTIAGRSLQGYRRDRGLWDAWTRYLSPVSQQAECPELPELSTPPIPEVPDVRGAGSACTRCDREGCDWCER